MTMLTYQELGVEIRAMASRATSPSVKSAWENLYRLTESRSNEVDPSKDPSIGAPWHLVRVEIEGFQGATQPLSLEFNPMPGITVLHGPNGSGKSTIAEAIRAALSGRSDWWAAVAPSQTRSGKSPLWSKVNCARDSEQACATVKLRRGLESLTLTSEIGKDGVVSSAKVTWNDSSGIVQDVEMDATSWPYAVESHPPVFSYADVERRVQQHEDLQKYIKNLLALGGCFEQLDRQVSDLSESAAESKKKISAAVKSAKSRVEKVDQSFRARGSSHELEPIKWSDNVSDIDDWLSQNQLTDLSPATAEVTESGRQRVIQCLREVDRSIEELHNGHDSVHFPLAAPLSSLLTESRRLPDPGFLCPVCDGEESEWIGRLAENVASTELIVPKREIASSSLLSLRAVLPEISSTISVLQGGTLTTSFDHRILNEAKEKTNSLLAAFDRHGAQPVSDLVRAFLALQKVIYSPNWEKAAAEAIELSNVARQWRRARRSALESYLTLWEAEHENAEKAALWVATKKCNGDLSDRLRTSRAVAFEGKASKQVRKLLEDSGISLESLSLSRTRAEVRVTGQDGEALELAMLSAGQRNAFLLAPLLATADAGPFGFLVLDDPVHSFDDIRVDRLAAVITELAQTRRVIVLTHDERLKEHLWARSPQCESWTVARDGVVGQVTATPTSELWRVLIEDAESVWKWSPKPSPTGYLNESQIIRGLLRQALDNAIRQCVIKYSLSVDSSVGDNIATLDTNKKTSDRLEAALDIIKLSDVPNHPVTRAKQACSHHLGKWNSAAHGGNENKRDLKLEIKAARDACTYLGEHSF